MLDLPQGLFGAVGFRGVDDGQQGCHGGAKLVSSPREDALTLGHVCLKRGQDLGGEQPAEHQAREDEGEGDGEDRAPELKTGLAHGAGGHGRDDGTDGPVRIVVGDHGDGPGVGLADPDMFQGAHGLVHERGVICSARTEHRAFWGGEADLHLTAEEFVF